MLWVFPERWASVFLLLAALWVAPFLGPALRGGLPLPHVGLRRMCLGKTECQNSWVSTCVSPKKPIALH